MKQKIAILADSGSDLHDVKGDAPLYILPLRIIIDGIEYIDRIDISLKEVLSKLDDATIKTSLPSPKDIIDTLDLIKRDGYTHVIAIPISQGLSGTMNIIRSIASEYEGLEIALIDTKNISIASGYSSLHALELIEKGEDFDTIVKTINDSVNLKKVFFTVDKLSYLKKGGRIGLVAATVADLLRIKPVISCNEEGIYHTLKKQRGYKRAINQLLEFASDFAKDHKLYDVTLLNCDSKEDLEAFEANIKEALPNVRNFQITTISPTLAIHTGPEALGIAVSIIK